MPDFVMAHHILWYIYVRQHDKRHTKSKISLLELLVSLETREFKLNIDTYDKFVP